MSRWRKTPLSFPATQDGMGIISYLKYHAWQGRKDPRVLQIARYRGDYLVKEDTTPDEGKYPRFPRSTGWRGKFPQPADCGSQADQPYEVQPDKGGIAGYALVLLYGETGDDKYLGQAVHNAGVLAANMVEGTATNSPWPFRVDYRTGAGRGGVSGNMSFILRLFDKLIGAFGAPGIPVFPATGCGRGSGISQLPGPCAKDGMLWEQFFEDHSGT